MNFTSLYGLFMICAVLSALCPIFMKQYIHTNNDFKYLFLSFLVSTILLYYYYILFQQHDLGSSFSIVKILSIILVVFTGTAYFNECLSNYQIVGLLLGIISIYLLAKN